MVKEVIGDMRIEVRCGVCGDLMKLCSHKIVEGKALSSHQCLAGHGAADVSIALMPLDDQPLAFSAVARVIARPDGEEP